MAVCVFTVLSEGAVLPEYKTKGAAGADLRACIDAPIVINSLGRALVPTGVKVELPEGYELQVRPRSGLALKNGVTVLNAPGTVDSDYRGELGVLLINLSDEDFTVNNGDRIAQAVVASVVQAEFSLSEKLSDTERGSGGYGSTGV